jgi:hypothetical protein
MTSSLKEEGAGVAAAVVPWREGWVHAALAVQQLAPSCE